MNPIILLLDCQHYADGNPDSRAGQVVECMKCSDFDTFRTVTVVQAIKLVRCRLNDYIVGMLN